MRSTPDFERAVTAEVLRIRDQLIQDETLRSFDFQISASGRVHDGDLKIEFSLDGDYSDTRVKGHSIRPVLEEFLRRRGWALRNQPLLIGRTEAQEDSEVHAS